MKKLFYSLIVFSTILLFVTGCTVTEVDATKKITSTTGIKLNLTWTTSGYGDDLDLYITKNGSPYTESDGETTSETLYLNSYDANATYVVKAYHYNSAKNSGNMTLKVSNSSKSSEYKDIVKSYSVDAVGYVTLGTIEKSGDTYTIKEN